MNARDMMETGIAIFDLKFIFENTVASSYLFYIEMYFIKCSRYWGCVYRALTILCYLYVIVFELSVSSHYIKP